MKFFLAALLVASAVAIPHPQRKDNPDERGNHFQGDIVLPTPGIPKNGLIAEEYHWPNGEVPYVIADTITAAQTVIIKSAMDEYNSLTNGCIKFVERNGEDNYVIISNDGSESCHSNVGMIGGFQFINYPTWCTDVFGSTLHEMLHTLGFYHEQSTYNRDDYVEIMWDNIQSGSEHNFDKYSALVVSNYGYDYDYGSVMHYSAYAFSKNDEMTIVTYDASQQYVIGQRDGLSNADLQKLKNMYNC